MPRRNNSEPKERGNPASSALMRSASSYGSAVSRLHSEACSRRPNVISSARFTPEPAANRTAIPGPVQEFSKQTVGPCLFGLRLGSRPRLWLR